MSTSNPLQARLSELRKSFAALLPEKVSRIEEGVRAFLSAPWTEDACKNAYRLVHTLAGSGGMYGYPHITALAREAEAVLKASLEAREAVLLDAQVVLLAKIAELRTAAGAVAAADA
jgi:chemotaxis protein histidine kinase CheA